jgi:phage-related baseplate assembly protein
MLYRQRVNDAARAHLLAFAQGADLDHKGAFYGVARLQGEDDARYRLRIQLRVQALSGQGTAQHYEHIAMTASLQVRAARAVQTWPGSVQILLWVHENADAAQAVQAVQTALQEPGACTLGVELSVALAKPRPIDITANLRREANAPADTVERIKATLAEKLQGYAQLGRAVPRSWISTCLHVSGIAQVTYPDASAPAEVTTLQPDEYPMLGTLQLRDDGVPA